MIDPRSARINIVMLSGGYDSTAVLCHALKNTEDLVIAHHVHLINKQGRHTAEKQAIQRIVPLAREIRKFDYSYTTFDYSKMVGYVWDLLILAHIGSLVASQYVYDEKNRFHVMVSFGIFKGEESIELRLPRARLIFDSMFLDLPDHKRPRLATPLIEFTKNEIVENFIPKEIKSCCWTCRMPVYSIARCGNCHACLAEEEKLNGH
jgi:hypothetical protein